MKSTARRGCSLARAKPGPRQGEKITGSGEIGKGAFGYSVALSQDGSTALIGGPHDEPYGGREEGGAAWLFVRSVETNIATFSLTSATFNATVNPDGEEVTSCHFEYGLTASYGTSVPCASLPGSGTSFVAVSALVTSLSANTTYHFRIAASNAEGTIYGADRKFTTLGPPEFGRCVKAGSSGDFETAACGEPSGAHNGEYEWDPGVGHPNFTTTLKEGRVTLETVKKVTVTCKTENSTGEYSGTKEVASVIIRFTGCESSGHNCTSAGLAEGEMETKELEGELGWDNRRLKKVALDLHPVGKTGTFIEYRCVGTPPITVSGSILVPVTVDAKLRTTRMKYNAKAGKQKLEHFEGEPADVLTASLNGEAFEQLGETATLRQTNEEPVEINAVV